MRAEILAAVARPDVAEVKPALVASEDKSLTARVLVPLDEIVALILSLRSFPILPVVLMFEVK